MLKKKNFIRQVTLHLEFDLKMVATNDIICTSKILRKKISTHACKYTISLPQAYTTHTFQSPQTPKHTCEQARMDACLHICTIHDKKRHSIICPDEPQKDNI